MIKVFWVVLSVVKSKKKSNKKLVIRDRCFACLVFNCLSTSVLCYWIDEISIFYI